MTPPISNKTVTLAVFSAPRRQLHAKAGGRADSARTNVAGFGSSASSKVGFIARKQKRFDAANTELQQMRETGTIKARGKLI